MFTGLVETVGKIVEKRNRGNELTFGVESELITKELKNGDSVNVNGVCQTVTMINKNIFYFDTIAETLSKTNLSGLNSGSVVNLERSLTPQSRLGGHFVSGHIDTTGKILQINKLPGSYELVVGFDSKYRKYIIPAGSIAIDGISLTVAEVKESSLKVAIIPLTWKETILSTKQINLTVNLEFDLLGKYVLNFLEKGTSSFEEMRKGV
ncbi:MAG: riboflavin synthase, partial [Ignavibacteriaceae bacterium]|nr:riboflavin synthase [Ignavibacteriaceae bacterium]